MKKIIAMSILLVLPTSFSLTHAGSFTTEEVAQHNSVDDCYVIFENSVYNLSSAHLEDHADRFMNIDSWCGKDMTEDFKTKAGQGEDHRSRTYQDLENYKIGNIEGTSSADTSGTKPGNPYNFWLPVLLGYGSYMTYWGLTKVNSLKKYKLFSRHTFNLTFNTILLLGLVPSAGFGYFMIARYSIEDLKDIDFDFLYWHVELSAFVAAIMASHFLTRFNLYKAPLKLLLRKNVNVTK
jgi:cytochrome b involved in lipid metabolism